jgi:hypothetical protein
VIKAKFTDQAESETSKDERRHICASQQNSLDPDCWDLCNLAGFGPSDGGPRETGTMRGRC